MYIHEKKKKEGGEREKDPILDSLDELNICVLTKMGSFSLSPPSFFFFSCMYMY